MTGSIGLLGTKPSWELMTGCDTLIMIGSGFPYSEFLPKECAARGVQIDIEPEMLSLRYPMEVNLVGDAAETLRALLPLLREKTDFSWRKKIEKNVAEWWAVYGIGVLRRYDPAGKLEREIKLPVRHPTMPAFGGDGLDTLYVTSANWQLSEEERRRHRDEGGLFALAAPVPGFAEPYARFGASGH